MWPLLIRSAENSWQVRSCREILTLGSPPLTHGKITTLHVNCITRGPQHGSFKAERSQNGKHLDRVPFYGYMGNVSYL